MKREPAVHVRDQDPSQPASGIPPVFALPLRLFLGITFLYAGLQKLLDPNFFVAAAPGSLSQQLHGYVRTGSPLSLLITHLALPHAAAIGAAVAIAEIWIGISTLAGLLAKIGAIGGFLLSCSFFLTASWTVRPYFLGPDLPYMIAWLTLFLMGPGPFNADAHLFSYVRQRPSARTGHERRQQRRAAASWPVAGQESSGPLMTRSVFMRGFGAAVILATCSTAIAAFFGRRSAHSAPQSAQTLPGLGGNVTKAAASGAPKAAATKTSTAISSSAGGVPTSASLGDVAQTARGNAGASSHASTNAKPGGTTAAPTSTPAPAQQPPAGATLLGNISAVPKNQAGLYTDPASGDPALLVHLPDDRLVAFDAVCPHAGCTVDYDSSQQLLVCPCHGASFDPAQKARVLNGPARQPLASLKVKVLDNGDVYALTS